jgi:hypothetical protein
MDTRSLLKGLHPLEIKTLLHYAPGESLDSSRLIADLGFVEGQANQAQAWLIAKSLGAETGRSSRAYTRLRPLAGPGLSRVLPKSAWCAMSPLPAPWLCLQSARP